MTRNQARPSARAAQADDARLTLLASIVERSDDAITSKTLDGIVTSWNPAAARMYGYAAAEIVGKPFSILLHGDRRDEMMQILGEIRAGRRVEHYGLIPNEPVRQTPQGPPPRER